jgi:hypothetical protein
MGGKIDPEHVLPFFGEAKTEEGESGEGGVTTEDKS